jgi:amino acid adenylation domain-containing protein
MPIVLQIEGKLDRAALQTSWTQIVRRHEVLRTNFVVTHDGIPIQVIHPQINTDITTIDLSHLDGTEQTQQINPLITAEAATPFNLEQDSLGRVSLILLAEASYILLVTVHHIIADGWSMGILVQELSSLYQNRPLADLPIQYADFAAWQRQILQGDYYQQQLQYWQQQLANSPTTLNLPYDYTRPAAPSHRGAIVPISLNPDLTQQLKAFAQKSSVTPFMLLLAAFSVLLSRYSGQNDLIIGSPIANRNRAEIESLIGFFVNTLPLRIHLADNPSFEALLKQIRQTCLDAYTHQDIPFEKLVEELQPERNLTQNPLFQVMFVLQNAPLDKLDLGELNLTLLPIHNKTAKFDLTLSLEEIAQELVGTWEYNSDLFQPETIERINQHFENLLQAILANPAQSIQNIPFLSQTEQEQILAIWNQTKIDYLQQHQCIHQLFEAQVAQTPDAVALVCQNQQLTYQQLNEKANQLAHHLQSLGVEPDTLVGICLERSLEMVIAVLGILKAGGAYVPLDPSYPASRLAYMLTDAGVNILLTQEHLLSQIDPSDLLAVCLDKDWPELSTENPITQTQPDNLAYLIYTSGSTGQPKGVALEHRSLVNLIQWQRQSSPKPDAKTLQFAPLSFDVSFQEIACTLCAGGTLVLIDEEQRRDFSLLWQLIEEEKIERIFLAFVALQQLAEVAQSKEILPQNLQEIITAGEQLQMTPAITSLLERLPHCILQNQYGPSESHVVTAFTLNHQNAQDSLLPPIGKPIANTTIYILDPSLQPVAIGVPGELHIGGVQLARGYHNQPELTQAKFIPHPDFCLGGGDGKGRDATWRVCTKLYRTGDLAKYRADGNIEFLGRIDNQVKIRGYRVELGEIESLLLQHPQIQEAVVTISSSPENKKLIAYLVPSDPDLQTSSIKVYLQEKLPAFMVPATYVILDALPLTPSGKIDRRSLPKPDLSVTHERIAPRNSTEQEVADIWADVLGLPKVGIYDNFFDLGGHSLLATQVMTRVKANFRVEIPLRILFESPTVADLAEFIVNRQLEQVDEQLLEFLLTEVDDLSDEEVRKLLE